MDDPSYYVGIDVGTGSVRVCIIDKEGEIVALQSKEIQTWSPQTDLYEQSTDDIWSAICHCCKSAMKSARINAEHVKGIGFDATCSLAVLHKDTDQPISVCGPDFRDHSRNVILWMDHRPKAETRVINATEHKLLKYVGGRMSIEMEIPKVLWLKNHMSAELFSQCKFYDLVDALTYIATRKETRSFCSTVCKQGFIPVGIDGSVKGWQEDFLEEIGLGDLVNDNYARIGGTNGQNGIWLSAGEVAGELCQKSAKELGLLPGIKIGSGVIDAYAGWVGTVGAQVDEEGLGTENSLLGNQLEQAFHRLALVAGTSTCHLVMSEEPVFVPGVWGPYRDVLLQGRWLSEGGQSATGSLLQNVLTTHPSYTSAIKKVNLPSTNIFDFLNLHLDQMREKSNAPSIGYLARHIFFYGDKHGNRSPIADPTMRGAVIGLGMDSGLDDLALQYYSAMEFIAQQTRHIIDTLNRSGHRIDSIFMSGSQCKNDKLVQLIANATGHPVTIPKYVDAAVVLGAAMLGAKAASETESRTENIWNIMNRMSQSGRSIYPTSEHYERRLLAAKYKIFIQMAETQQIYRKEVDDAIEGWTP